MKPDRDFNEVYSEQLKLMWNRYHRYALYVDPILKGFTLFMVINLVFGFSLALKAYVIFYVFSLFCGFRKIRGSRK